MARASTPTKLPLDTWAKIMGIHPMHFNQVRIGDADPHCSEIMFQHEWQNTDHVSREEIARAIADAETKIENYLGYHLAPTWDTDEWHGTDRPNDKGLINYNSADVRGMRQTVRAKWGYIISGGTEVWTPIQVNADIVYSDIDGDGYKETATVTVNTVVLDKNEIAVFYPEKEGDLGWEIKPIEVSITAGVATITFSRHLAVESELTEAYYPEGVDGMDDDNFLEVVDIYRHYNDPQTQASFLWEPFAGGWCFTCNGGGCSNCAYTAQTGCLLLRGDPRQSILGYQAADWDNDNGIFTSAAWNMSRQPDIVRLYYYSGWRNKNSKYVSRMDPEWERIVARMAAAMLDRPACDCNADTWDHWRQDLTLKAGDEDGKPYFREPGSGLFTGSGITENPFGTRRGEVDAWRKVRDLAIRHSASVG